MRVLALLLFPFSCFCQGFPVTTATSFQIEYAPIQLVRISKSSLSSSLTSPTEAGKGLLEQSATVESLELFITCSPGVNASLAISFTGDDALALECQAFSSSTQSGTYTIAPSVIVGAAPTTILTPSGGLVTGHVSGSGIPFEVQTTRHSHYGYLSAGALWMQLQYELR